MPGIPEFFISSATRPSTLATASSMRPAGICTPDTSFGGTCAGVDEGFDTGCVGPQPTSADNITTAAAAAARFVMAAL